MRTTRTAAMAAVAMIVAACNQPKASSPDEALSRDLALAASEAMELAPNGGTHSLSASEISPPVTVAQRYSVTRKPSPNVEPLPEPVSIEPADVVAIADVPQMAEAPVGVPVEIDRPAPARRPAPMPVVRGGAVGHDDCKIHPPRRGGPVAVGTRGPIGIARGPVIRGGVAINNRIPRRTVGTFPR